MAATPPHEARSRSQSSTPPPSSSSAARLWRPAAQRNLRNQWYMDQMDFGVLSDMANIRKKACSKLLKQQVALRGVIRLAAFNGPASHRSFIEANYCHLTEIWYAYLTAILVLVAVVTHMVNSCKSMRCYSRGTSNSPLAQFSFSLEDDSDSGDCGGIPVFTFCSIASFGMCTFSTSISHISHLVTSKSLPQRLLVMELLSVYNEKVAGVTGLHWSDEFYDGEFNDLSILNLYSKETYEPILPCLRSCNSSTSTMQSKQQQDSNVLQVYLTTWLVEVNIDRCRMDEIYASVGGEMHIDFLETFG
ncbi:hypothetical protein DH2020_043156 [Rehmannia glutinosa]|uniref:Uncharacterized protein n=1 Tax=Rehmannia glutinosa TaxID=99300 RepID=A0ABR0UKE9_REHGL